MSRLGAKFQQERGQAQHHVRVAVQRVALAVQVSLAVGHGIDQLAALLLELRRHGRSEGAPLPTIQDLADWIELLLEKCGAGDAAKSVSLTTRY